MADELGWADAGEEDLVRESFIFLLEREPPTSILSRFGLGVIGQYFPEYPSEIRGRHGPRGPTVAIPRAEKTSNFRRER